MNKPPVKEIEVVYRYPPQASIDLVNTTIIIGIILATLFFAGEPDLMDAIIYKLTGVKGW